MYCINQQLISWCSPLKYLGLLVDFKSSWSKHCMFVVNKGTRSLNCLRGSMFGCSCTAKYAAYKGIVHPTLEYAATAHNSGDIHLLEVLQNHAARWICGSCWNPATNSWTISLQDCCFQLCLPFLQSRRKFFFSVRFLHNIYNKHTSIVFDNHLKLNSTTSTRSHHLSLVSSQLTINSRRYSFFVHSNLPVEQSSNFYLGRP